MRRALPSLIAAAAVLAAAQQAAAVELHLLGAADLFGVTSGRAPSLFPAGMTCETSAADCLAADERSASAQLGFVVGLEANGIKDHLDLRLDGEAVVGLTGYESEFLLYQAYAALRHLGGRVDLVAGRFVAPGGFFLVTDGAMARVRLLEGLVIEAHAGLRALDSSREELHLTGSPVALPVVGGSISFARPAVQAQIAFTWTRDRLTLHRGWSESTDRELTHLDELGPGGSRTTATPLDEDELFLTASATVLPHATLLLAGGATLGTRYDLTFWSVAPAFALTNVAATVGSFAAWAIAEWKPIAPLRLGYVFDFDRVRILQSKLYCPGSVDGNCGSAAGGSFEDHTLRLSLRPFAGASPTSGRARLRGLRLDARYRLRLRENTDVIHRVEAGLYGDDLLAGLGFFATLGIDEYSSYHAAAQDPSRVVYQAGLSFMNHFLDVRGGLLYTDAFLAGPTPTPPLSFHQVESQNGGAPTAYTAELFPFVLEAQRVVFLRAFASWAGIFGGVDAELNLDATQLRLLAQVGYAR